MMKTAQLAALCFLCLSGIMPIAASAQPFAISADGSEVTDQRTGLIWRRCSEGRSWNGFTCTGTASTFTHGDALQHAAIQASSTGIAWRLPNVKELASIADKSYRNPAIDSAAFPATPASLFWSATPSVSVLTYAWHVDFFTGSVANYYRVDSHYVRLVRNGQ